MPTKKYEAYKRFAKQLSPIPELDNPVSESGSQATKADDGVVSTTKKKKSIVTEPTVTPPSEPPASPPKPQSIVKIEPRGFRAINGFNGFSRKNMSKLHSPEAIKRYVGKELEKLKKEFDYEIEMMKSKPIPLAQTLAFSNIDQYIIDAMAGLENCKQTLTVLRTFAYYHMKQIAAIGRDLQEEIQFISKKDTPAAD
ncbi:hypothetical protein H072_5273 [Dactylellina haptotyla CBS 200.50]|uniref:Uncharacterized protein n=1 Tax=Dactylellina haptotyla (strain CBS 200.50) TaxID=1284197 RepID=S8AD38_DACHA|nr:hypothetical protein H072_5273 [Dactylellina haptotyla CBS 200.50]